ncbi:MAG: ABC transporter ATP-binding protein [Clostridiales bacterium]|nr:ABC transporter ATP-binding protein [Clostridiales bacterium]
MAQSVVLELKDITKSFDNVQVLKDIDLTVHEGEFVTLLGPSGCGKTTTLRIIAGLEFPDGGQVLLEGANMENTPPEKRNVNMVFQNYALFPHMNVQQNIGYGLKIKKVPKDEIRTRVEAALKLVQMEGFEKRMPAQMSGGQRQRVAIARAIVGNPKVLLLDEPLGALDLQLRRQMQLELKHLQKELGITFIYITHDQEEAINMSDRIVVMRNGTIEQAGTPDEVYNRPRTSFVAKFVGSANVLTGTVTAIKGDTATLSHGAGTMGCTLYGRSAKVGDEISLAIRGENIAIGRECTGGDCLMGIMAEKSFAGGMLRIVVRLSDGTEVVITRQGINFDYDLGETVLISWAASAASAVDEEAAE